MRYAANFTGQTNFSDGNQIIRNRHFPIRRCNCQYYWQVCAQFRRLKQRRWESPELSLAFGLSVGSFMLQSFLLIVGVYDPNFQRVIFWCFYALSILMLLGALELEGHTPDDWVSRLLNKFIHFCAPPFVLVWNWVERLISPLRR